MAEMIWEIGLNKESARRAGKEAGKANNKEQSKVDKGGGGAFAGGFIGSILGSLLSSVQSLFEPLSAIAGLLVAALFPILKPFLILFIKVGILLYKWLNKSLSGLGTGGGTGVDSEGIVKAGDGLKSALFIIGAIIGAIAAAFLGAPALIIGAVAILGGLLVLAVGGFLIDIFLRFFQWIDNTLGTNFIEPLRMFFDGVSNIWNGLWNTLKSLLTLDFKGVWEGLKQMLIGVIQVLGGIFGFAWELLKSVMSFAFLGLKTILSGIWQLLKTTFIKSFEVLKSLGKWIVDKIKGALRSVLSLRGGRSKSVNDAIITPGGDIIRTNPSDYLIATKTPGSIGGGSGIGKIDVTINGGLITEDVARNIRKIIMREIKSGGSF